MTSYNEEANLVFGYFDKCEQILNNDKETFQNKAESLVDAWKQLRLCGTTAKIQHVIHLLDWAKLHTLNIVLSGDWKKFKDLFESRLLDEVEYCERELHKLNNSFSLHCKKLSKVIRDPWGNATLCKLLNTPDPVITRLEFDFFIGESGYLVSMRLKKLCESHCEDLALNLVTAYMRCCDWAESNNFNMNLTEDQKRFMLDVYIALLYKYKKTPVIVTMLKQLSLQEGLELVTRFAKKRVEISKLWRHSNRITHLAAVLFTSAAIIQPFDQISDVLSELVEVWLSLGDKEEYIEQLVTSIRRVLQVATSASHMYIFCEAIYNKFGQTMKTFNIELYIQALTTDLNYLERQKSDDNKIGVTETSQRLANGFLGLADVLDEHTLVCRECVLTSFSLQPTAECLQRIEKMAQRSGFEVLDTGQWKCKMHPPVQPSDELCTQCTECGDFMSQMQLEAAINTNVALNEALTAERLGLRPELCDDLVVVVCSPRYQLLSWLQKWSDLHRLCIMYLNDPERTKNFITDLKFLEIDYSIFMNIKREPADEEEEEESQSHGYEDVVETEFYSDPHLTEAKKKEKKKTKRREKTVKTVDKSISPESFVPPKASTDPDVLKTLRSFRRNFKRTREGETDEVYPNKLFIGNNDASPDPESPAIQNSAQNPAVSGYYPSVNYDYYGNVNSSANNEYLSSYDYNGYYYPYNYYNNELGNTNSTYNYGYKCSENFSNLNNVDYKIKLQPQPQTSNSSVGSTNSASNSETRDYTKDCALTLTQLQDCSKPSTSLNTNDKERVENLNKSLTERLITSLANDVRQQKTESERLTSMKKLLHLSKTLNLPESRTNETSITNKTPTTSEPTIKRPRPDADNPKGGIMTKTHQELQNLLKARCTQKLQLQSQKLESQKHQAQKVERESKQNQNPQSALNIQYKAFPTLLSQLSNTNLLPASQNSSQLEQLLNEKIQAGKPKSNQTNNSNPNGGSCGGNGNNLSSNIGTNLSSSIGNNLRSNIGTNLSSNIGTNLSSNIENNLSPNIGSNLSSNIENNLSSNIGNNSSSNIGNNSSSNIGNNLSSNIENNLSSNIGSNFNNNFSNVTNNRTVRNGNESSQVISANSSNQHTSSEQVTNQNFNLPNRNVTRVESNVDIFRTVLVEPKEQLEGQSKKAPPQTDPKKFLDDSDCSQKSFFKPEGENVFFRSEKLKAIKQIDPANLIPDDSVGSIVTISTSDDSNSLQFINFLNDSNKGNSNEEDETPSVNFNKAVTQKTQFRDDDNSQISKNSDDTCSHSKNLKTSVLTEETITAAENKDSSDVQLDSFDGQDKNCAYKILKDFQQYLNSDNEEEEELFSLDGSRWNCSKCEESDWDGVRAVTDPSTGLTRKKYRLERVKQMKALLKKLEITHNPAEDFIEIQDDLDITLKEKYNLKEVRVILNRFNIKPVNNKFFVMKSTEETSPKKPDHNVPFKNSRRGKGKKNNRKNIKRSENKSKVPSPTLNKDDYIIRSWPLQDMNPRVICDNKIKVDMIMEKLDKLEKEKCNKDPKNDHRDKIKCDDKFEKPNSTNITDEQITVLEERNERIPRVLLQRLDVRAILANVPGLHDTEMIRPGNVNSIVQVVQVAGGRPTATTPSSQTSTQVSPHIQRIGQPRIDKPDSSVVPESSATTTNNTKSSPTTVTVKPATSQPSTLINILSQQIIRPGQGNSSRPRTTGPFINILSQQIVKPANNSITTVKTTDSQANTSTSRILSTGESQVINQLVNPIRTSGTTLKTVVANPGTDQSRIVQLICKSADGKLIPVTSFTPNRVVKVATTQTVTSTSPSSPNFDDSLTKLVQVSSKTKSETAENPETLPKFQQAFGKTVYQNNVDSTNTVTTNNVEVDKNKPANKNTTSVNVQPIQGGVIYTRQVPVGQAINLIPPNRGQVFRIATSNAEQISLVKDTTVIHNKMSALLAAALQGKQKNSEVIEVDSTAEPNSGQTNTRVTVARPTLVHNARIVKPVLQIPSNVIRNAPQPNLSSTTLEQLREFDMVYKQVKERSSTTTPSDSSIVSESPESSQRISVTYLNQPPKINCSPVLVVSSYNSLQPAASPALSVASQGSSSPCVTPAPTPTPVLPKVASKGSKGKSVKNTTLHTSKASPVPKPQQKPQEDEHTTQRIFDILAEYAEQLRNSPDLNNKPAPRRRSNPPTNPSQNSKRKKSSSSKKSGQSSSTLTSEADLEDPRTIGSEDSSCGVVQVSMQEEETTQSVTVNATESNEATVHPRQQIILTESSSNQTRNLIIADSSVGEALKMPNTAVLVPGNYIMPVSMVKGGQQIAVVSGGSKILATVPARSGPNMLLFQSFLNQNRKTAVPTVKYSTIQPIAGISSPTITGVNTQQPVILQQPGTHGISTVTLSQPLPIKKIEEPEPRINTELLLTISQSRETENSSSEEIPQPDSSTNVSTNIESIDLEENATLSDTSSEKTYTYQKPLIATPIATPVIAQTNSKDEVSIDSTKAADATTKTEERVQSVLVTAGTSNGPMLSHSPPRFTKQPEITGPQEQNKDDFSRNGGKRSNGNESKNFQANNLYTIHGKIKKVQSANSQKLDRELQQLCLQRKQAALERELRLQKSLSEECEDLGVDEPSTSDLFPEADLLFDSNHSPSFDQSSQDIVKRTTVHCQENKEESKLTLFSDDDFLFEPGEYQTAETELVYDDQSRLLTNGQSSTSTESGSPCGDNTLLQTCTSMSDVTLNSPISPDTYNATTPPPLNKYVHKYSNRKKDKLKQVENWPADVSSSEDTTGSTELIKSSSRSPELCANKQTNSDGEEELSENNFKVVRVAISKTECEEIHCSEDADCSVSGRGARRSVKKMCSCCNGSQDGQGSRKRPTQPHTPIPHKKAFLSKKR